MHTPVVNGGEMKGSVSVRILFVDDNITSIVQQECQTIVLATKYGDMQCG